MEDNGQRILRHVHASARAQTERLLDSDLYRQLTQEGLLVGAVSVEVTPEGGLLLEHPRIALPSYPFEWTPGMLADAATLTLDIQRRAWAQGWTLKDAAANNVLFDGTRPVFCDLLSLRNRQADDAPGWQAYGQFVRHFILPLLAVTELGRTPRDIFLAHRDGLRAAEISPFIPWYSQMNLAMWLHVRLPARLERRRISKALRPTATHTSPSNASDGTPWLLNNLQGFVARLNGRSHQLSAWSAYTGNRDHYADAELEAKRTAVASIVSEGRYASVLDVGANSGEFSQLAAQHGARQIVALDDDLNALNALYRHSRTSGHPIQCLHANMARPTPATGWQLAETLPLPERFAQRFDLVLMLAVVHHLVVTERLPLPQLFIVLSNYCSDTLLIEFVPRDDPRFIEIAGPNIALYDHWDLNYFLASAQPWFELQQEIVISTQRRLLRLRRR
ncbi:class I SAM-dependent methyltransferase [Paucibacter sp. PLA-PC-4]|uniref:class I SAM-dependent methyltransferase n=1 Tax=Paucibacter sp. PLA-PC-4 TaxID=2993655 RepID=UPI00224B1D1A|nr:class I SAM-dependent methyltransferase [Paucibacter sp. PLA-PC-4]MCX2865125.1 class I SAM-dependent methyltransferase [Paucibacter sp. PLA-PC-4]